MPNRSRTKKDPAQRREYQRGALEGNGYCRKCLALFMEQRWFFDEALLQKHLRKKDLAETVCPACVQIDEHRVDGVLTLTWSGIPEHKDEIMNLIQHEEEKEKGRNALSRIISKEVARNRIEIRIHTTTQSLATRLGRAIDSAYKGELRIKKTPGEPFVRVDWTRQDPQVK